MVGVIVIAAISIAGLIASILFLPSVQIGKAHVSTYWMMPLLGGIVLLASGLLSFDVFAGNAVNPLQILAIFFSMVFMSIVLDEVGFFRFLASVAAKRAKQSQTLLFILLYIFVSVLTVFTSNDIIVITFTPFIIFFSRHAKISPLPYLIGEFVAANTWSALLLVGNPTNIYLAGSFGIDFLAYVERMFIPTLFAGFVAMAIIFLSWGIALFEYCFQVPANRIGSAEFGGPFSIWELKVIQEVISLLVFTIFALVFMKSDTLRWNHLAGFLCIILAVYFIFRK